MSILNRVLQAKILCILSMSLFCFFDVCTAQTKSQKSILATSVPRDYFQRASSSDKEQLAYILRTLANSSLTKLYSSKSALTKAGDKVDHLHPLQFWACIVTDVELLGCLHAVRDRKTVWREFSSDCANSFAREASLGNIKKEHVNDFAALVGLKSSVISSALQYERWTDFFDILIEKIPRGGDSDHYDM